MIKCSVEDCGNKRYARGFCTKHYARLLRNGHPEASSPLKKGKHYLLNKNLEKMTANCAVCGRVKIGMRKKFGKPFPICMVKNAMKNKKSWKKYDEKNSPYRKHKKSECEKCGFVPIHSVQLDVDHIDNNHNNNDLKNLQTLCANCHRYKSLMARKKNYKLD